MRGLKRIGVMVACVCKLLLPTAAIGAEESQMQSAECALGTGESDLQQFHLLAHYPYAYALRFPGLVIGVEKSGTDRVLRGANQQTLLPGKGPKPADEWTESLVRGQRKAMFVSHVLRTPSTGQPELAFNAYDRSYAPETGPGAAPSAGMSWVDCKGRDVRPGDSYAESWRALDTVRKVLDKELQTRQYSHVLLIVMGWNTNQSEATQNVHSIRHQLAQSAPTGLSFNPYVVALTWPSQWDSNWLEVLVRIASLSNKANDADEIGAGWLGAVLRHSIVPATKSSGVPLVAIGHSFGARALSNAICLGTRLAVPETWPELRAEEPEAGQVASFINLQGAYSLNRFREGGAGVGIHLSYPGNCPAARQLVFTASKHDTAGQAGSRAIGGGNFAGSKMTWDKAATEESFYDKHMPRMALFTATKSGAINRQGGTNDRRDSKFKYVNADQLIRFNATGTGAGAHSDIYRIEIARALWHFLDGRELE